MAKRTKGKKMSGAGWSVIAESSEDIMNGVFLIQKEKQKFHFAMEKRNGKTVTLIKGLVLPVVDIKSLAKELKNTCGTGGTIKENNIELQGEYREKASEYLKNNGWGKQ